MFKPGSRTTLAEAISSVLDSSTDFQDTVIGVSIGEDKLVEEDKLWVSEI